MRSAKVPESPSSALQVMYFCCDRLIEHRLPFDAGGERGAAAASQPRIGHRLDDLRRAHGERVAQALVAAVRDVIGHAERIDDADALEGQPLLAFQIGDVGRRPQAQRMRAAVEEIRREEPGDIGRGSPGRRRCRPCAVCTSTSGSSQ